MVYMFGLFPNIKFDESITNFAVFLNVILYKFMVNNVAALT